MKRLLVCAFALVQLSAFGAAYQEAPQKDADFVKPFNVHKLISVTQGESKMPFQIAYKSVGADKLFACLVADPQLNELFPDVAIAQETLGAIPETTTRYNIANKGGRVAIRHACDQLQLSKISTAALKEGKVKSRLTALFILSRTLCDPADAKQTECLDCFFNNSYEESWNLSSGNETSFCVKVHSAGAVLFDYALSESYLVELKRRGEHAAIADHWKKKLETNGHDFAFVIKSRDVEEYFAHQALTQPAPVVAGASESCLLL